MALERQKYFVNIVISVYPFVMKTKVLDFKNIKRLRTALPKTASDPSFKEDWGNGISGEEVVRQSHKHIEKLYAIRTKRQTILNW